MSQIKMWKFRKKHYQIPIQMLWRQHWDSTFCEKISPHPSVTLSHVIDSITNGSVR